jgi:high-affinity Fe2+/Pb2+ permease
MGAWLETIGVILGALAALVVIVLGIVLILGAFLLLIVIPLGIVITAIVVICKVTRKVKKAAKAFKEAEEEFISEMLGDGNQEAHADYEGTYTESK